MHAKKLAICVEVQCEYSVFQLYNAGIVRVANFKFIGNTTKYNLTKGTFGNIKYYDAS